MPDTTTAPTPAWLRALGVAVLGVMAAGLAYAVAIALLRFSQIGV
jgi:hypothetical protein